MTNAMMTMLALASILAGGCGGGDDDDADADGDADADVDGDGDTDADADGDGDADADGDGDGDGDGDADCGALSEPCCGGETCDDDAVCCTGQPYPEGGSCELQCDRDSDVNIKRDFASVDVDEVLERVAAMPVSTWTYQTDAARTRHMGPMAQDFHAAFAVGSSDRKIDLGDANAVALAAIQALHGDVTELRAHNARLEEEVRRLRLECAAQ